MEKHYSIKELQEVLNVSRGTVMNWRKQGLPYLKIGRTVRFNMDDVKEWLDGKRE